MKNIKTKKVKKGLLGAAIMSGVGIATSVIQSQQQAKAQAEAQFNAQKSNYDQSVIENEVYADEFKHNNINDLPTYAKGGNLDVTNKPSTTGKLSSVGGDLLPISDNAEVVSGNDHEENKVDGSYGVTLSDNGEPVANVEDEEVIVNNDLVFSDKLKKGDRTFADIALEVNTKIGRLQDNLKSMTKPSEKFSTERTIQGLEKTNTDLFAEQEAMKQQVTGAEEQTAEVVDGSVPVAAYGMSLTGTPRQAALLKKREGIKAKKDNRAASDAEAEGTEHITGINEKAHDVIGDVLPLVADNVTNLVLTHNAPDISKPIARRAPIIDTRINANPQLASVTDAVNNSNIGVLNNTNNSAVARANITATNLKGARAKADIYGQKQSQERTLQNEQNRAIVENSNNNIGYTDQYNQDVYDNQLERSASHSANVTNLVEDYTAVKQTHAQQDNDDMLIDMSLLDDPTGEKARYMSRTGRAMTKESKAAMLREFQRIQAFNNTKTTK